MKKIILLGIFASFLILSFSGCTSVARIKTDDYTTDRAKTDPSTIEVYSTDKIGKKYKVIGTVVSSADAGIDADASVSKLKEEAGKLGGDAIINLRLAFDMGYMQIAITSSGEAVIFEE